MSKVVDVINEEEILKKVDLYLHGLKEGIHGLSVDFGFHIDDVWKNQRIFELSNNISYRLFSSRFHFHLLFNHIVSLRKKYQILLQSDVPEILHLEIDKQEQSSLMDSIIFHLSSVMDYAATLINYVISKNTNTKDWVTIKKSAKAKSNIFLDDKVGEVRNIINDVDVYFVNALYAYRSELIHNTNDVCGYEHSWDIMTNNVSVTFYCSKRVIKNFKQMGSKGDKYTVTYFAQFVIFEVIDVLRRIISSLRKYLTDNLKEDEDFVVSSKKPLIYFDKEGNRIGAASVFHWREFDSVFKNP